jgi:hypothetical protein
MKSPGLGPFLHARDELRPDWEWGEGMEEDVSWGSRLPGLWGRGISLLDEGKGWPLSEER